MKRDVANHLGVGLPDVGAEAPARAGEPRAPFVWVLWLILAVLVTLRFHPAFHGYPYSYAHSWVSAHMATIARSFVHHGVIALGGVPIQNNPPLGLEPDAYLHWPPLFPMMLSVAFRVFGESERVAHGLMLVVQVGICGALYALARTCAGRRAALFAVFSFLVMPVTIRSGHVVSLLNPAILGMLLSILGFIKATPGGRVHRGWAVFGATSLVFGIFSSWEPLLAAPGLLAAALWRRRRSEISLAVFYLLVSALPVLGVMTAYLIQWPALASDLWHTVGHQIGLWGYGSAQPHLHTLANSFTYTFNSRLTVVGVLERYGERLQMIGQLAAAALGVVLITAWLRRNEAGGRRMALAFGGLLSPWVLWYVIMVGHAYDHDYQMLLAAPVASLALGLSAVALIDFAERASLESVRRSIRLAAVVLLPGLLFLSLPLGIYDRYMLMWGAGEEPVQFGLEIRESTQPGAVVMVRKANIVPVYYSERHLIRGVADDTVFENALGRLGEVFPGSPAYLAFQPADTKHFPKAVRRFRVVKQSSNLILLALPAAATSQEGPLASGGQHVLPLSAGPHVGKP